MAITSIGYEGSVDYADWALLNSARTNPYGVIGAESFECLGAGPGTREVRIAPGVAGGAGILDTSDAVVTLEGAAVASGSRWDMIVLRRNWETNISQLLLIQGAAAQQLPARQTSPGVLDDQPIAMVRFAAGQEELQDIVGLRVWQGAGGAVAESGLCRSYLTDIGTRLWVGGFAQMRVLNAEGTPVWVPDSPYVGPTAPPVMENLVWVKKP